jgi:hypothetical protein
VADIYQEFCDAQMTRAFPLTDDSYGQDLTGAFHIPESLMTDIFLCAPNLASIDTAKFYVRNITLRRYFLDITIGYEDVTRPLGVFRGIRTDAPLHTKYDFTPSELQTGDEWTPLFFMTGQIVIGSASDALNMLGSWTFEPVQAHITPTRVSKGLINVQYLSVDNRLLTGNVRLKAGANVTLSVVTQVIGGQTVHIVEIGAALNPEDTLQLTSDADVYNRLISDFGVPIRTINGLYPDANRNFTVLGADCTAISSNTHGIVVSNPCASPCCDEDSSVETLMQSISSLNLRYAQLKAYFDAQASSINNIQNKLLVLNAEL